MTKTPKLDDQIDLRELIKILWGERFTLLLITSLFFFLGYFYAQTLKKNLEFRTVIILNDPSAEIFSNYDNLFYEIIGAGYSNKFKTESSERSSNPALEISPSARSFSYIFNLNVGSSDNLQSFIAQNNKITDFSSFLKVKNVDARQYFNERFGQVLTSKNEKVRNNYFLIFPKVLEGNNFLNDYVEYVKNLTIIQFKDLKKIQIKNFIRLYEKNFEIAKAIQLEVPMINNSGTGNYDFSGGKTGHIYNEGTKVLSEKINYLKKLPENIDQDIINYSPILDKGSTFVYSSKKLNQYPLLGLIVGIFSSIIFIFLRKSLA